jgi:hypothetical protein
MGQQDDMNQLWQQSWARTQSSVSDFWQSQAAYWQTVADIMARRAATISEWYQGLPQQFQTLGQSPTMADFAAEFTRWQQATAMSLFHLNVDTQHQRSHLFEEWQKLAERNGFGLPRQEEEKPVVKSSYYAANPQAQQQATKPVATPAPQAVPKAAAPQSSASSYSAQPVGTFIPGPAKKIILEAAAPVTAPASSEEPNGHEHRVAPEPARNAAQAATLAGATSARRSVVASHRSRAGRRSH